MLIRMPSDPLEDTPLRSPQTPFSIADFLVNSDLDLDESCPFYRILSGGPADSASPLVFSCSEHPCSPLLAFSDHNNDGNAVSNADFRPLSFSNGSNHNLLSRTASGNDGEEKFPSPCMGLMPMKNFDGSFIIKERMTQALRYFKDLTEQHVLAQVWAPIKTGDRYMLTTSGQPFVLDPNSNGLHRYRLISLTYMFAVDGDADGDLGLPGRVFRQKLPEWTPNVQFYSSKEFRRLNHASDYNVQGTIALPIFDASGQCIGVLELIMTTQKINYEPEVDKICKALKSVNLKCLEVLDNRTMQICNEVRQDALAEILEIISVVCETHSLPLAQAWVPCRAGIVLTNDGGIQKACTSFDGSCMGQVCLSTTDVAFYIVDARMWGFHEACAEHHLQKGQGVAGKAFASRYACLCKNITVFCKSEYPLVHYARMFGLRGSFAICLRSMLTGNDIYVLEFFLPIEIRSFESQQTLLQSVLATMKQHIGSLRVASGKKLDLKSIENVNATMADSPAPSPNEGTRHPGFHAAGVNGNTSDCVEVQNASDTDEEKIVSKKPSKKRGKAEKTVSLEVLRQYFSGSLKNAAKSLGVCPTTMKRICRQHGISRWPSRKINKVNRSLTKLKQVMESVQGGDGTFHLSSMGTSSIQVAVGGPGPLVANMNGMLLPFSKPPQLHEKKNDSVAAAGEKVFSGNDDLSSPGEEGSRKSRARCGSKDDSTESRGSQSTSPVRFIQNGPVVSSMNEQQQQMEIGGAFHEPVFSNPDKFLTFPDDHLIEMPVEGAGSSHDLRSLCPPLETPVDEPIPENSWTESSVSKSETIIIKATYKEDIIRFRVAMDCGIVKLQEEVGKRLKMEGGVFGIKYRDDDLEWVSMTCDSDLEEYIEINRLSGCNNIIRLSVQDVTAHFGSSCDSNG